MSWPGLLPAAPGSSYSATFRFGGAAIGLPSAAETRRIRLLSGVAETSVGDADIQTLWEHDGGASVYLTAALVCEAAAALPATGITSWSADGVSVSRGGDPTDAFGARAGRLRAMAAGGIGTIALAATWAADGSEFG